MGLTVVVPAVVVSVVVVVTVVVVVEAVVVLVVLASVGYNYVARLAALLPVFFCGLTENRFGFRIRRMLHMDGWLSYKTNGRTDVTRKYHQI